jgi:hypothetical protein
MGIFGQDSHMKGSERCFQAILATGGLHQPIEIAQVLKIS